MDNRPVIQFKNVSYFAKGKQIFNDISLAVRPGEFVAVLGPNGAGKSTLLNMVMGLLQPTAGEVLVLGKKAGRGNPCIGYSPQTKAFDEDLPITGREYVKLGLVGTKWGVNPFDRSYRGRVQEVLKQMDALRIAGKRLGQLSGGEQQRISLAEALVNEPDILLLDEPLANLDLSFQQEIVDRLAVYHKGHHHTILLVAHDVNPLLPYIDKVIYLANTHAEVGKPRDVITEDVLSRLYNMKIKVFEADGRLLVAASPTQLH